MNIAAVDAARKNNDALREALQLILVRSQVLGTQLRLACRNESRNVCDEMAEIAQAALTRAV